LEPTVFAGSPWHARRLTNGYPPTHGAGPLGEYLKREMGRAHVPIGMDTPRIRPARIIPHCFAAGLTQAWRDGGLCRR